VKYAWIGGHSDRYSTISLCRVLRVSKSGYYDWRGRPESRRSRENRALVEKIRDIPKQNKRLRVYGSPRIHEELVELGYNCSKNRVARLMRANGIRALQTKKFRVTTDSKHNNPVAQNVLDRKFDVGSADRAWASDITYVWTREGWLYLAVVIDLFNRMVVGWSMGNRITQELTLSALRMALWKRKPGRGLLSHSDRGSQYTSVAYRKLLSDHGIVCSMSRKGNCWDNAVAESFFHTLKTELVYHEDYATRAEAKSDIFDWIEVFYNRKRRHSSLGYLSPARYEAIMAKTA
jgi:transposase InsO family protein